MSEFHLPFDLASEALQREMRDRVRDIFEYALSECSIPRAFGRKLQCDGRYLRIDSEIYDLEAFTKILVVSMGKAGHTMAEALANVVGTGLTGIVASPT